MKQYQHYINGAWTDPDSVNGLTQKTPIQVKSGPKLPEVMRPIWTGLLLQPNRLLKEDGDILQLSRQAALPSGRYH